MKLVIRLVNEGKFYQTPNLWVTSHKEATKVERLEAALECLNGRDLSGLELVVLSDEGHPGLRFNLSDIVRHRNLYPPYARNSVPIHCSNRQTL